MTSACSPLTFLFTVAVVKHHTGLPAGDGGSGPVMDRHREAKTGREGPPSRGRGG
jgi:hypothetical protein